MVKRLIVCVFACLLLAGATDAAPRYKVVILNPSGFTSSNAFGVSGGQQVGWGSGPEGTHALLWSGTAESYVDLHPTGFCSSGAYDVSGGQQVGNISPDCFTVHLNATLWSGTAQSYINLHPSWFDGSDALCISGGQQVGYGLWPVYKPPYSYIVYHALLWSGTPGSCVDLHPSTL